MTIRNGVIDVTCLNDIVKDNRNFHIEINILNAAFKAANIRISNDPVIDTRIAIYTHHCDEIHNWTCKRSKYYYDHIVEQVLVRPSCNEVLLLLLIIIDRTSYELINMYVLKG